MIEVRIGYFHWMLTSFTEDRKKVGHPRNFVSDAVKERNPGRSTVNHILSWANQDTSIFGLSLQDLPTWQAMVV